jgi:hypothetical protein
MRHAQSRSILSFTTGHDASCPYRYIDNKGIIQVHIEIEVGKRDTMVKELSKICGK